MTILDVKLITKNNKILAIRVHDGNSPEGYYALIAEGDNNDMFSPIEAGIMKIAGMRWQNYTHYTQVWVAPQEIAFYDEAKEGQTKLYWSEIMNYDTFECILSDEQVAGGITKKIPMYLLG